MSEELLEVREKLNILDKELQELLVKRFGLSCEVADIKLKAGIPVSDPVREKQIIDRISDNYRNTGFGDSIASVYEGIFAASRKLQSLRLSNVWLIGMPGCGKSTVGRALAEIYGIDFIDCDDEFEKRVGICAGEYINQHGNDAFRVEESRVISELSASRKRTVISAGGGIVTIPSNYDLIKASCAVVYIKRDISKLSTEGRPLSQGTDRLQRLYDERHTAYEEWSDFAVENDSTPQETARIIAEYLAKKGY